MFNYGTSGWISRYLTHASYNDENHSVQVRINWKITLRFMQIMNKERIKSVLIYVQFLIGSWRGKSLTSQ